MERRPGWGCGNAIDADSAGPVIFTNLGGGICPATDVFRRRKDEYNNTEDNVNDLTKDIINADIF